MSQAKRFPQNGEIYGMLAFAGTGLASLSIYAFADRIEGEPWRVVACFITGAIYILAGSFSSYLVDDRPWRTSILYTLMLTALGIATVYLSPLRGLVGIILLPLASQVVFMYPRLVALAIGIVLWMTTAGVFVIPYGWDAFSTALLSYSPAYIFTVLFSFVTHNALNAREHAINLKNELESANAQLVAAAQQTEELATTRERNRVAREIHDGVGHYLTVINIQLEAAQSLLAKEPDRAAEAIGKATRLSRDALADVRRSVGSLRSDDQPLSLADALRDLTTDAGVPVELEISGPPRKLSSAADHALFRAAQEGLTNIRKHAAAQRSWIRLDFADPARTRLTIEDNGVGSPTKHNSAGFGLKGMHERVELLGGSVTTGNRDDGGFSLQVEVPA